MDFQNLNITFRQLEIFVTVARLGHVTNAGEELGLTQAAVSLSLTALERQFHSPLFLRTGKRLILNDRGRLLLKKAEEVLRSVRMLVESMTSTVDDPAGILRVGASTTIGNYLLPALIGKFLRRYRRAKVELMVGNTNQIEEQLASGYLDLGLIEGPSHRSNLINTDWRNDELVVVAAPRHPWTKKGCVTLRELEKASWLAREHGSGTREVFEEAIRTAGLKVEVKLELGHTEAIKQAAAANLGVACLSRLAVTREISHGWLAEIKTPLNLQRKLLILQRQDSLPTPLLNAMLTFIFKQKTRLSEASL
ncbi:MAG: LysR family transcriptional regulator [Candidatus Riflebacteria bacterium]|nr:LysR family transcriptional regulator [Candidatus Riflebacteria bacterium]